VPPKPAYSGHAATTDFQAFVGGKKPMKHLPEWDASRLPSGGFQDAIEIDDAPDSWQGLELPEGFDWKSFREMCTHEQDGISAEDQAVVDAWRHKFEAMNAAAAQRAIETEKTRLAQIEIEKKMSLDAEKREEARVRMEERKIILLANKQKQSGLTNARLIRRNYQDRKMNAGPLMDHLVEQTDEIRGLREQMNGAALRIRKTENDYMQRIQRLEANNLRIDREKLMRMGWTVCPRTQLIEAPEGWNDPPKRKGTVTILEDHGKGERYVPPF